MPLPPVLVIPRSHAQSADRKADRRANHERRNQPVSVNHRYHSLRRIRVLLLINDLLVDRHDHINAATIGVQPDVFRPFASDCRVVNLDRIYSR